MKGKIRLSKEQTEKLAALYVIGAGSLRSFSKIKSERSLEDIAEQLGPGIKLQVETAPRLDIRLRITSGRVDLFIFDVATTSFYDDREDPERRTRLKIAIDAGAGPGCAEHLDTMLDTLEGICENLNDWQAKKIEQDLAAGRAVLLDLKPRTPKSPDEGPSQ